MKNKLYIINRVVLLLVLIVLYINPLKRDINIKYLVIVFLIASFFGSFSGQFLKMNIKKNSRLKLIYLLYILSFIIIGFMVVSYILNVSFLFD